MFALRLLLLSALLLASQPAVAQTRVRERPSTVPPSCTAEGRHREATAFAVLHAPLTVGSCRACHTLKDSEKHTFELTREGSALCLFCHQVDGGTIVHPPMTQGTCLDCHNPHGGSSRGLLTTGTARALCVKCHKEREQGASAHRPAAGDGCMACHAPHASDHEQLLRAEAKLLCLDCHVSFAHRLESSALVHKPVAEGCLECHDAHASGAEKLLKRPAQPLCLSCHEDIRSTVEHARTQHGALVSGRRCLNCHDPHATEFPWLLQNYTRALCMECHDHAIETPEGAIRDMSEILAEGKSLHGPIARDDCSACHQIHGGDVFRLLIEEYPSEFYSPFQEKSCALCFSCHDPSTVLEPRTTLTGFRNGDVNLHFLHVNRETKGRTCRACHETHAGDRPKHIRESAPFGNWKIPIGFTETESGGSCASGCHAALSYDRDRPVE